AARYNTSPTLTDWDDIYVFGMDPTGSRAYLNGSTYGNDRPLSLGAKTDLFTVAYDVPGESAAGTPPSRPVASPGPLLRQLPATSAASRAPGLPMLVQLLLILGVMFLAGALVRFARRL